MARRMTHMPFFRPNTYRIERLLCAAPFGGKTWKLHAQVDSELYRVATGFPEDVVECAPTFWEDDSGIHVSLIAGMGVDSGMIPFAGMGVDSGMIPYRLYLLSAKSLTQLINRPVVEQTEIAGFTGFVNQHGFGKIAAFPDRTEIIAKYKQALYELTAPGRFIYRLSYCPDNPAVLLVSGGDMDGEGEFSLTYHLETGEQQLLTCDGVPGYKAALCSGEVQYASRCGQDFEDREVLTAKSVEFRPCSILTLKNQQMPA